MLQAVDCMGFAGGFTLGMVQAGYELIGKRELPGGFGVPNCEANRELLGDRWRTEVGPAETWTAAPATVVFGNPPCSGFSVMTDKRWRGVNAKINSCMWEFAGYVQRVRPVVSIMESVRVAFTAGRELMQALRAQTEETTGLRFDLYHVFQDAIELGGAAHRPRYFMVMSQVPFGVEYPTLARRPVLRDIIEDLEGLDATWELQPYRRPPTWWSKDARADAGVLDGHDGVYSPYVQRGLALLEANGEWPEGWPVGKVLKHYYERTGTVPDIWKPWLEKLIEKEFFMGFTTMVRWRPDRAARVITGAALQSVLHPWLPRTITNREAARIMGFPDDWRLLPLRGNAVQNTHGKGITVQCGRWIGKWVQRSILGEPGSIGGELIGEREWFITAPGTTRPKFGKIGAEADALREGAVA
jgi:site-specific DNA-cytosine methylase